MNIFSKSDTRRRRGFSDGNKKSATRYEGADQPNNEVSIEKKKLKQKLYEKIKYFREVRRKKSM